MGNREEESSEPNVQLIRYLQSWGLREFHDEASYYEWQRSILSGEELQALQRLIEGRHGGREAGYDIEFYDVLARPDLVPVLYSQRFHYFLTVASAVCRRISPADRVLDFGCGLGILTSFYAQQHPDIEFVGIDRSSRSIETARFEAEKRQLTNIRFEVSHLPQRTVSETYDLILSTQALFQAEREPGLPSRSWETFERVDDLQRQEQLEIKTGLQGRLNALVNVLRSNGRMIIFEKTWNLGRRIFFQRALNSRGFRPVSQPSPFWYRVIDEEVIDGPLYEVARIPPREPSFWNEKPYREAGETLYRCKGLPAERMGQELALGQVLETVSGTHSKMGAWVFRFGLWNQVLVWGFYENSFGFKGLVVGGEEDKILLFQLVDTVKQIDEVDYERLLGDFWGNVPNGNDDRSIPCYENHLSSAQIIYEALPSKHIQQESTFQEGEGREMHIELGTTKKFFYLYLANTFDQRQLVLVDEDRAPILKAYYRECLEAPKNPKKIYSRP